MGKKPLKWDLFQKMAHKQQIRIGLIFGKGRRAQFIELIMPSQYSAYVVVGNEWSLVAPKDRMREIYDVSPAFKPYYSTVQNFLNFTRDGLGGVSINGDFIITADEVVTFSKEISKKDIGSDSILRKKLREVEDQIGVNLEDSAESSKKSEEAEPLDPNTTYEIELVDSDSEASGAEMEKFIAKSSAAPMDLEGNMGIESGSWGPTETFEIGVLYPLITIVEFVKRSSKTPSLCDDLLKVKEQITTLEQKAVAESIKTIEDLLGKISDRLANKLARAQFLEEKLGVEHAKLKKIHDNSRKLLNRGVVINETSIKATMTQTEKELRANNLEILKIKESAKRTIRTYTSLLNEILEL